MGNAGRCSDILADDSDHEPPAWLKDEQTRLGICHMLDYDRAVEEQKRVLRECIALQDLAQEEWDVIHMAKNETGTSRSLH